MATAKPPACDTLTWGRDLADDRKVVNISGFIATCNHEYRLVKGIKHDLNRTLAAFEMITLEDTEQNPSPLEGLKVCRRSFASAVPSRCQPCQDQPAEGR